MTKKSTIEYIFKPLFEDEVNSILIEKANEDVKPSPGLFDIISTINKKDQYLSEDDLKNYNPFIVNKNFAGNRETVFFANEMNQCSQLPKSMQYDFYYNIVSKNPRRRFVWSKKDSFDEEKIYLTKEYLKCSTNKAKDYIELLDTLDIWDELRQRTDKGGVKK